MMRWPTTDNRVSSPYGYRTHPITGARRLHAGTDFPYPGLGAQLVAVQEMRITEVSYNSSGGHIVKGRMPDGVYAGYFHMRERSHLNVGDLVSEGGRVGFMGTSGASTGPHLHFETRRADGSSFDPVPYLQQGTAAGGGSNPFPTPEPDPAEPPLGEEEEEEDDMPKNTGIATPPTPAIPAYRYLIFNYGSGIGHEFSGSSNGTPIGGAITGSLAVAFDTTPWAEVSESHYNRIVASLNRVQRVDIID